MIEPQPMFFQIMEVMTIGRNECISCRNSRGSAPKNPIMPLTTPWTDSTSRTMPPTTTQETKCGR